MPPARCYSRGERNVKNVPLAAGRKGGEAQMVSIQGALALFIAGIGVGIGVHRLLMAWVLDHSPDTLCSYCKWLGRKKSRHKHGG